MTNYAVNEGLVQAVQYELTLDGNSYISTIYWMAYAQRLYINISDQYGNSVLTLPLIGSPSNTTTVNILAGYFTQSSLYYYPSDQLMVVV